MSDPKVNIELKLRPLRLAFLVNPNDKKSLIDVIWANSCRWGGINNLIIPAFFTKPRNKPSFQHIKSAKQLIVDSVNFFDPDYVVEVGDWKGKTKKLKLKHAIIRMEDLRQVLRNDGTPSYGISLFELLDDFIEKELKFIRTYPINSVFPKYSEYPLFFDSVFGALDKNNSKIYEKYKKVLKWKEVQCSMDNFFELLSRRSFFLRRFLELHLHRRHFPNACFLMDAAEPLDVIDYWNIRALGGSVLPVPKQAWSEKKLREQLLKRAKCGTKRKNHDATVHFFFSDSVTESEARSFLDSLGIPKPKEKFNFSYIIDPHIRNLKHIADRSFPPDIEAETAERIVYSDDRLEFRTLDPEFADRFGGQNTPRFANEITFRSYSSEHKGLLAEVFPRAGEDMIRSIGGMGEDWHVSRSGIVYLSKHIGWTIYMSLPQAEPVFRQMLETEEWKIESSTPGKAANLVLSQLGGIYGIDYLKNEEMLKLLNTANAGGKSHSWLLDKLDDLESLVKRHEPVNASKINSTLFEIRSITSASGEAINEEHFYQEIKRIAQLYPNYLHDPQKLKKGVCDIGMFQVGISVQCPKCNQRNWYAFDKLQYELRCKKCLQASPIHTWEEFTRAYRTFGPFSLPGHAYGAYAVLITLDFFKGQFMRPSVTPMMSFTAKKVINGKEKEIEADLGLLMSDTSWEGNRTRLLFCECKTFNNLKKSDKARMSLIANEFPDAILVFATLNKSLSKTEKKLLLSLLQKVRRQNASRHTDGNLLILTGNELFALHGPPYCWKGKGADFDAFSDRYNSTRGIAELCDITVQLYLKAEPESHWWQMHQIKKHSRRKKSGSISLKN